MKRPVITHFKKTQKYRALIVVLLFVITPVESDAEIPILSRLIFNVNPDSMTIFERIFEQELAPVLQQQGLKPARESGRATLPHILSRIYIHNSRGDLLVAKQRLQEPHGAWRTAVQKHRDKLIPFGWEAQNYHWRFDPYVVPAGSGQSIRSKGMARQAGKRKEHWQNYGIIDGLPSVNVRSIFEDRSGHIWFGTESGVTRFDGQNWRTFTVRDGLPTTRIISILEDQKGHLWFGTETKGLARFDGTSFRQFDVSQNPNSNTVLDILEDHQGHLWFTIINEGICRYDGKQWDTYTTQDGLVHNSTHTLFEDSKHNLWIGTEGGLSCYNGQTFENFTVQDGLPHASISDIVEDLNEVLWIGTNNGLARYDLKLPPDRRSFEIFTTQDGLPHHLMTRAFVDDKGDLWFGTEGGGAVRYDGQKFHTLDTSVGLAGNYVVMVTRDREGHYWFATGAGASRYSGETFQTLTVEGGLPNNVVLSIAQDAMGNLWFGTKLGAIKEKDDKLILFDSDHGLLNNEVRHIYVDRSYNVWVATLGGLTQYNGETFTTYTTQDGLPHDEIRHILEDAKGNIWFVTWRGRAVCKFDGETFTTYTFADGLPPRKFWTTFQDRSGTIWVGGYGGLSRFQPYERWPAFTTYTTQNGLPDNEVRGILEDKQGRLWFTTFGGLAMLEGRRFTSYTRNDGLIHNEFRALLQDQTGDFWFGTYGLGVHRWRSEYPMALNQILTDRDGLAGNQILCLFEDRNGAIWFGTTRGVTRFMRPAPVSPRVSIQTVIADQRYDAIDELTIPSNTGIIAFEFDGMSVKTRPEALRYRYRLNGFDDQWQMTNSPRIEYSHLSMGTYTFEVEAFDRDLVKSSDTAKSTLHIQLPTERIIWSILLALAASIIIWQTVRVIRRDHRLAQALETQLLQSSRLVSLGEMAAGVVHELNQPLTAISTIAGDIRYRLLQNHELPKEILDRKMQDLRMVAERMSDTVDHLRVFSRDVSLEPSAALSLNTVIHNSLKIIGAQLKNHGIDVQLALSDNLPPVWGQAHHIEQVFLNLLANARDALDEKEKQSNKRFEKQITVQTHSESQSVIAVVKDNGHGMSEETQVNIFEPFFTTKEAEKGTGLGLSISQAIIKNHNGEITCQSTEGEDTAFQISLPTENSETSSREAS